MGRKKTLSLYIFLVLLLMMSSAYAQLNEIAVTGIRLDKKNIQIPIGYQETIKATVYPTDATNKNVYWATEDSAIVKIEPAGRTVKITAMAPGNVRVTAVTRDGNFRVHCQVEVIIAVKNLKLDQEEMNLSPGEELQLNVAVFPADAYDKDVIWESTNAVIATVNSDGLVEALEPGEVRIIARSVQDKGVTAYCNLVINEMPLVEDNSSDQDDNVIELEENSGLNAFLGLFNNNNYIYIGSGLFVLLLALFLILFIKRNKKRKENVSPSQHKPVSEVSEIEGISDGPLTVRVAVPGPSEGDIVQAGSVAADQPLLIGTKGEYSGQSIELGEDELFMGRDHRLVQLVYPVEQEKISRRHCSIRFSKEDDHFVLVDFSAVGTFLGTGKRLEPEEEYILKSGDKFYLADPTEEYTVK